MQAKREKWTSSDIMDLLRDKYAPPAFAVLPEMANATGLQCDGRIDAAVFSLWPSNGLVRMAVEIKVSRSDFLRELQDLGKNKWAREYFHEFWFATPPGTIKEGELPEGIGWLCARGDKLCVRTHARRKENAVLDDAFLASMARLTSRQDEDELARRIATNTEHKRGMAHMRAVMTFLSSRYVMPVYDKEDHDAIIAKLEEASTKEEALRDKKHVMAVLDSFQDQMADLAMVFLALSEESLLARDETGKHVVKYWGGVDERNEQALLARAKKSLSNKERRLRDIRNFLKSLRAGNGDKEMET